MALGWKPNGTLDVATAPTDLPEQGTDSGSVSIAFARCKNLSLERMGRIDTRAGSSRPTAVIMNGTVNFIIEQGGKRYAFAGTNIYRDEVSIISGLAVGQWSAVKYNQFNDSDQQIFALNGTDRKRINGTTVSEWGIDAPTTVPTVAVGAGTGLTGAYKAKYTYARKVGAVVVSESNPSGASASQSLANQDLKITWTASADAQVTHVRLYRTLAEGDIYFHDQDVAIGAVTVDTSTLDTALGGEVAIDHDRPPTGEIVAGPFYNGVMFISDGNLLYFSKAKQPEYWPVNDNIEVGQKQFPIKAIVEFRGQVIAITKNRFWFIQGTGGGAFNPVPLQSLTGAPNPFGAAAVEGKGIFHVGHDGIYLFAGGRDAKITQSNFDPIFTGTSVADMPAASTDDLSASWLFQWGNRLFFHWGSGNVLVFNLDNDRTTYYRYDMALFAPAIDHTNDRLYVGDASKFMRQLETGTDDIGTAISWEAQTKDFTLQTRRHFPRFVKHDTTGTMTGALLLDGVIHQEHKITESRNTVRRLVNTGNANRCAIRLTGTGAATIYAVEAE